MKSPRARPSGSLVRIGFVGFRFALYTGGMRIAVNARTLSTQSLRGWSRYTSNLFREMTHLGVEVFFFSDRSLNPDWLEGFKSSNLHVVVEKGINYVDWEQRVLPKMVERLRITLLHCPIHYGLPLRGKFKKILTLHDAIEVAYAEPRYSFKDRISYGHLHGKVLNYLSRKAADHIVTVSEYSKADICKFYGWPSQHATVVLEAADPVFKIENTLPRADIENQFSIRKPYFFYIGGLEDRKNIPFLIQGFSQMTSRSHDLVLAGGDSKNRENHRRLAMSLGCEARLHFLENVDEVYVPSLYRYAHCFVYPSLYEGFGLQLVEAMEMGCPVLTSSKTSLGEIYNFPEAWFDPEEGRQLTEKLNLSVADPEYFKTQAAYQQKRRKDFNWVKAAQETLNVYKAILSGPRAEPTF